jgi:hypothetical protein
LKNCYIYYSKLLINTWAKRHFKPVSSIHAICAICAPEFQHTGALTLGVTAISPIGSFDANCNGKLASKTGDCVLAITARLSYVDGRSAAKRP